MPRRKHSMALGPGFHLCERGLDNRFSRPFSHQPSTDLPLSLLSTWDQVSTWMPESERQWGKLAQKSQLWDGSECGFQKEGCVQAQAHPKPLQKSTGVRISPPTCERWHRGWRRHMLATIMHVFPKWAKINYTPKTLTCWRKAVGP